MEPDPVKEHAVTARPLDTEELANMRGACRLLGCPGVSSDRFVREAIEQISWKTPITIHGGTAGHTRLVLLCRPDVTIVRESLVDALVDAVYVVCEVKTEGVTDATDSKRGDSVVPDGGV